MNIDQLKTANDLQTEITQLKKHLTMVDLGNVRKPSKIPTPDEEDHYPEAGGVTYPSALYLRCAGDYDSCGRTKIVNILHDFLPDGLNVFLITYRTMIQKRIEELEQKFGEL